jgi:hypothetical protein
MTKKRPQKKCVHSTSRYWYHISTTLKHKFEYLTPRDNRGSFNRSSSEPNDERICVAPTLAHCLTAVPYVPGEKFTVYRTARKCIASSPKDIYDATITKEKWIQTPTMFNRIGFLSLSKLSDELRIDIIGESASSNSLSQCGKVLKWWKRHKPQQHIKRA